ncbi:MAG: hypothetical protein ABIP17_08205 [Ilumatobacteraceae bacterium]
MGFRDRFYTPTTAEAILSWRLLLGVGVGIIAGVLGLPIVAAIGIGAAVYTASVMAALPRATQVSIDPFVLGEPWRRLMQDAQGASRKLQQTVSGTTDGPLRATLQTIADQLERGLTEAWAVALRGDEIDTAVRRLDPTALRSKLATTRQRAEAEPSPEIDAAVASVERQIDTADRLKRQSAETADALRLTQTSLDELVARASEVQVGVVDTDAYRRDVDDLVIKLEALHQAVEETRTS